jgi:hypothetical protein
MIRYGLGRRKGSSTLGRGLAVALAVLLTLVARSAVAQGAGGNTGGGGGGANVNTSNSTTSTTNNTTNVNNNNTASGVMVDAQGVLRQTSAQDPTGELARQRVEEALGRLDHDVAKSSPLRKISLTRLERIMAKRIAGGQGVDDMMKNLAGLTRIEYVFCYPESGDIVLAGPAEAWAQAPSGRMQGIVTGRPVIELQDLVVALRAFPAGGDKKHSPFIYCSIDPTEEGEARLQEFMAAAHRQATPADMQYVVQQIREKLGMQVIKVGGVPANTHFAQVLVEADYRMKLIGIGLEVPPVRLKSYAARANPAQISQNALERWYFVPDYQCVRVSDDALAMQLVGEGVKLVGEGEVVGPNGQRTQVGKTNSASQQFVDAFTKIYPKLAEKVTVYAQLRNCIDMAVAAAFIQEQDYYGLVKWTPSVFTSEEKFPVQTVNAPKEVETAVNGMWKGMTFMTPMGGGVTIKPTEALNPTNLLDDKKEAVEKARSEIDLSKLSADQWWWD